MSLNWDLTDIDNHEEVCWDVVTDQEEADSIRKQGTRGFFAPAWHEDDDGNIKVLNPITNALIWMMMGLGCQGKIDVKNVEDVVVQVMIEQRVAGAPLRQREKGGDDEEKWEDRYITADEVRAHLGMKTNCFGNTKRRFKERIWKMVREGAVEWCEERIQGQSK